MYIKILYLNLIYMYVNHFWQNSDNSTSLNIQMFRLTHSDGCLIFDHPNIQTDHLDDQINMGHPSERVNLNIWIFKYLN